jgi:hypothetical protein
MAEPKTVRSEASAAEFLATVADPQRRADAQAVCELMTDVTGAEPVLWGGSIIGFGTYQVLRELVADTFRRLDGTTVTTGSD